MANTRDLLKGVAALLAGAGIGVTYNADGTPYTAAQTGVFFKDLPNSPDRAVVLTAYTVIADDPAKPLSTIGLQVRTRGTADPTDVDDLADAVVNVLQGATGVVCGSVTIVQALRKSMVPMGMDDAKRHERADNFYVDLDVPATANRPAW